MIVPGRKYKFEELEKLKAQNPLAAAKWSAQGYVWRMDLDGTMQLVHWTQASGGGGAFGKAPEAPLRGYAATNPDPFDTENLPKIVRRTPQERVASLMKKIDEDVKAGRVLSLDKAREITGDKTADVADGSTRQAIAASFLDDAEKQAK